MKECINHFLVCVHFFPLRPPLLFSVKRFSNTFTQLEETIGWRVVNSDSAERQKNLRGGRSSFIIALLLAL